MVWSEQGDGKMKMKINKGNKGSRPHIVTGGAAARLARIFHILTFSYAGYYPCKTNRRSIPKRHPMIRGSSVPKLQVDLPARYLV